MNNLYLIPARDADGNALRVPDPVTHQALPGEGAWKERTQYWLRRLAQGDVTEGAPLRAVEPAVIDQKVALPAPRKLKG